MPFPNALNLLGDAANIMTALRSPLIHRIPLA